MRTGMGHEEKGEQLLCTRENLRLQEVGSPGGGWGWGGACGDGEGGKVMLETVDCCCQCRERGGGELIWGKSSAWFLALNLRSQSLLDWSFWEGVEVEPPPPEGTATKGLER